MGVSSLDGIVSPAYNVYEPRACLDPSYVDALVRFVGVRSRGNAILKGACGHPGCVSIQKNSSRSHFLYLRSASSAKSLPT